MGRKVEKEEGLFLVDVVVRDGMAAEDIPIGVDELQEVKIGKRVFVGNLAWRTSWQDLVGFCSSVQEL